MLGSVTRPRTSLQEAFLRYHRAESAAGPGDRVAEGVPVRGDHPAVHRRAALGPGPPRGLPGRVAARAAAHRGRRRAGRAAAQSDPAAAAEQADTLSMAFLLLLERLSPVERAVFLLHDVFSYGYGEVASIVGKSEDNCRRWRCAPGGTRPRASPASRRPAASGTSWPRRSFARCRTGIWRPVGMLAADVVVVDDNAGVQPAGRVRHRPGPRRPAAGRAGPADPAGRSLSARPR